MSKYPSPPPPDHGASGHSGAGSNHQAGTDSGAATPARPKRSMVTDLAAESPRSAFDRVLQWVPEILSSKTHIVWLIGLGVYLILLPLVGVAVSAKAELIGGNYTNVTSDIGACIAAGGTLHLVRQGRRRQKLDDERLTLLKEVHTLLHHVHPDAAAELGHAFGPPHED
jgi:hypothetical protein